MSGWKSPQTRKFKFGKMFLKLVTIHEGKTFGYAKWGNGLGEQCATHLCKTPKEAVKELRLKIASYKNTNIREVARRLGIER